MASEPPKTSLDVETEAREARKNGVLAAKAWGIALGALFPAFYFYTPPQDVNVVFIILAMIGGFAGLGGAYGTAKAVLHGATVLVLRAKPTWRLPMQITIALGVPLLLSLYFLLAGVPTWAAIQPLLSWDMLIPLAITAFFGRAGGSLLDRTVPVRGFLIAAYLLFVLCIPGSLKFTSQDVARYLIYVAVSYGGMLSALLQPTLPSLTLIIRRRPILWASLIGLCILGIVLYNWRQTYLGHLKDCKRYGMTETSALRDCAKHESVRKAAFERWWKQREREMQAWFNQRIAELRVDAPLPENLAAYIPITAEELQERYDCCQFQFVWPSETPSSPAYGKQFALIGTLSFSPHNPADKESMGDRYSLREYLFLDIDMRKVPSPVQELTQEACDRLFNLCQNVTLYGVIDVIYLPGRSQLGILGFRVEHIAFQPQPLDP